MHTKDKTFIIFSILFIFSNFSKANDIPLKEKISQLIMASVDINEIEKAKILAKENIGGIQIQWGSFSLKDTKNFTSEIYRNSKQIPPFIAIDYEGGSVFHPLTLGLIELPTNMMLGAANDSQRTASLFYLAGLELKKAGINMALAPVLDVNTNKNNPIIGIRSFSSNPEIVSKLGNSIINGFKASGIIPVIKHFPGHGESSNDSHKTLPIINLKKEELMKNHILPFKKNIENKNADFIMTAHILYPDLDKKYPASLSKNIMKDILKGELNYQGAIITDSLDMKAITYKYSVTEAAIKALNNGADLLLIGREDFFKTVDLITKEVIKGNIPISRINEAYEKILDIKARYKIGVNDNYNNEFDMAYNRISNELSEKAITLIKNEDIIPLDNKLKISTIFFMPQRFSEQSINLYKNLKNNGYNIYHYNFPINPKDSDIKKINEIIKKSDLIIIGSFQWGSSQNKNQKKALKEILNS